MRTMILQISDLHAGIHLQRAETERQIKTLIDECVIPEVAKSYMEETPERFVLILNGDFVDGRSANKSLSDHKVQFELTIGKLIEPLIKGLRDKGIRIETTIAVPGNHDVSRRHDRFCPSVIDAQGKRVKDVVLLGKDRSRFFYDAFKKPPFHTPEHGLEHVESSEKCNNAGILFWPVDSSIRCGARFYDKSVTPLKRWWSSLQRHWNPTPPAKVGVNGMVRREERLDFIQIPSEEIDKLNREISKIDNEKGELPQFRAAVVHHNPFATTYRREPHLYENEGEFIKTLLSNDFKILFHGHNHETSVFYLAESKQYRSAIESPARPLLESGILCIGARSLWPELASAERGFNIVTIDLENDSFLANIRIKEITIGNDRLASANSEQPYRTMDFRISTKRINDLPEPDARIDSLARLTRSIYSMTPVEEFDRRKTFSEETFKRFSDVKKGYSDYSELLASYAVNNLSPGDWRNSGFMDSIFPFAQRAWSNAVIHGNNSRGGLGNATEVAPRFRFSRWLCKGIEQAEKNGKFISPANLFAEAIGSKESGFDLKEKEFVRRMALHAGSKKIHSNQAASISFWARKRRGGRALDTSNYEPLSIEIEDRKRHSKALIGFTEIPRILLWPVDWLKREAAHEIISFHENWGIPLFWIDPKRLVNKRGNLRSNIGYIQLFGLIKDRKIRSKTFINNNKGEPPRDAEYLSQNLSEEEFGEKIWGKDPDDPAKSLGPDGFVCERPIKEFRLLLSRPDILFAVDAWVVAKCNPEEFEPFYEDTKEKCSHWLSQ